LSSSPEIGWKPAFRRLNSAPHEYPVARRAGG
jgi:hypothetical protein